MTILLLSDSPSELEKRFSPFGGPEWKVYFDCMQKAGMSPGLLVKEHITSRVIPEIAYEKISLKKPREQGMTRIGEIWTPGEIAIEWPRIDALIRRLRPKVILCAGAFALNYLLGETSLASWHGSFLDLPDYDCHLIPTFSCRQLFVSPKLTYLAKSDFRRAKLVAEGSLTHDPQPNIEIPIAFPRVIELLRENRGRPAAVDTETYAGTISVFGFSNSESSAVVIPFSRADSATINLWTPEQEVEILREIVLFLQSLPELIAQNWAYDNAYVFRNLFYTYTGKVFDTMLAQHMICSTSPKRLHELSALYLGDYRYWKDDAKGETDTGDKKYIGSPELWRYNGLDCINTFRLRQPLGQLLERANLTTQFDESIRRLRLCNRAMARGVRRDHKAAAEHIRFYQSGVDREQDYLRRAIGRDLDVNSPKVMQSFFYEECKLPKQLHRVRKNTTCDDEALQKLGQIEPLVRPLTERIGYIRSAQKMLAELDCRLGPGNRFYTSFNVGGTTTFRLNSRESPFGEGLNFQNRTKGTRDPKNPPKNSREDFLNYRELFIPDPGWVFWEGDLERADLNTVVWDSGCERLKEIIRAGIDLHRENAKVIFNLTEDGVTDAKRQLAKKGAHSVHYDISPRSLARDLGITVKEAEAFIRNYLGANPEIAAWQKRIKREITTTRMLVNMFGYRFVWLDRMDYKAEKEALAWKPQSHTVLYTDRIWQLFEETFPQDKVQTLIQCHDSLAGQVREDFAEEFLSRAKALAATVVIPYNDPLVIPFDLHLKQSSWGK